MIIKSISTEKVHKTKELYAHGQSSTEIEDLYDYVTDPLKTHPKLTGGYCCSPTSFLPLCRLVKRHFGKITNKQIRHIVIAISPLEDITSEKFLSFSYDVCGFFEKKYYAVFSIHQDRPHTHVHIIINNTSHIDGRQLSFGESELAKFKEFVNETAAKYGLKPIEKVDDSIEDPYEIDDELFKESDSKQFLGMYLESQANNSSIRDKSQYGLVNRQADVLEYGNLPLVINLFLPYNFQFSTYTDANGRSQLSARPYFWYDGEQNLIKRQDDKIYEIMTPEVIIDTNYNRTIYPYESTSYEHQNVDIGSANISTSMQRFNIDYFINNPAWLDNDGGFHKE